MTEKTGRFVIIEQFLADGISHMFGNPGTVEQGFLDALSNYPEMSYVLTLHETVALMMADGYARATKKPALVQIHSTPGLGNTIGAMYQAMRGHSPLIVIGGDAGLRYMPMEAQMYGDLVAFAEPVTKWATMVKDHRSLLRTIRRAIKVATTPPMGPVYVCLPADILDMPVVEEVHPTSIPSTRVAPDAAFVQNAAKLLADAEKPMIYVGDGVAYARAQAEITRLAEIVGAEVWGVDSGEFNMSYAHPLWMGQTGHMFGEHSRSITTKGDVNFICGTYMVPEVFPELGTIYAPDAKNIHVDLNAYAIAKNHPVDLGVVSDPKLTTRLLIDALVATMTSEQQQAAVQRARAIGATKAEQLAQQKETDQSHKDDVPMKPARFMAELATQLPDNAIIFDEALTCSPELTRYMPPTRVDSFFQTRGGSLGVGIPGALGAKLANPDNLVIGFTGDGGSMYTIQALWTAAHHNIDTKFVICNNQSYKLLKLNIEQYWKDIDVPQHDFPQPFDLTNPTIDFVALAQSMGVPGVKVTTPQEIGPAIERALEHKGPFLIDLLVTNEVS